MKKPLIFSINFMMIITLFFLNSCSKPYNPSQKIERISHDYHYSSDDPDVAGYSRNRVETWTWENNKLKSVHYNDMTPLEFEYDGRKLSKITWTGGKYLFLYNNGKLEKMEMHLDNVPCMLIQVNEYKNNKIVSFSYYEYFEQKELFIEFEKRYSCLAGFLIPHIPSNVLISERDKADSKGELSFQLDFFLEYKNSNVISQKTVSFDGIEEIITFTYDAKENPFYSAFHILEQYEINPIFFSKNNILSSYDQKKEQVIGVYEYEYDDKWPTSKTTTETWFTERYDWDQNCMVKVENKVVQTAHYEYQ